MTEEVGLRARTKRPIGFVLLGCLLLASAGWLVYDVLTRNVDTVNLPSVYEYKVHQDVSTEVSYKDSTYYNGAPGFGNTAYVTGLTNAVKASFHYDYSATREANLTSTMLVVSTVRAKYILGVDGKDVNDVWSKDYRLVPAVTETKNTQRIVIDKEVTVPFTDYRNMMEDYRATLQLPVTTEVQIMFSVHVTGTIDGAAIDDTRTSTVTAPLDQPIFKLTNKFDKDETKQIAGKAAVDTQAMRRQYERIGAGILAVLGIVAIVYGMRRHIFKSAYQRELDKIYRYHDGIIIRANRASDMADKHVVAVSSFDDILNLEEELKTPIVASSLGPSATRFMIIHGDIVYAYTLGAVAKEQGRSLEEIEAYLEHQHTIATEDTTRETVRHKTEPVAPPRRPVIQPPRETRSKRGPIKRV